MTVVAPAQAPTAVQAVAAPTPTLKHARGSQSGRAETMQAVDPAERGDRARDSRPHQHRGQNLDIVI